MSKNTNSDSGTKKQMLFYNSTLPERVIRISSPSKIVYIMCFLGIFFFSLMHFYCQPTTPKVISAISEEEIPSPLQELEKTTLPALPALPETPPLNPHKEAIGEPDELLSNEFLINMALSQNFDPGIFLFLRNYLLEELSPRYRSGSPFGIGNFLIREKSMNLYFKSSKFDYTTPAGNAMAALLVLKHLKKYYGVEDLEASLIYLFGFSKVFSINLYSEVEKAKRYLNQKEEEREGLNDSPSISN